MIRLVKLSAVFALLVAMFQFAQATSIYAKAWASQYLLDFAWHRSLNLGAPVRPWPWADNRVVGRLQMEALDIDLPVMDGEQGSALAFAPGLRWLDARTSVGSSIALIQGHRDTHMAFMKNLSKGDALQFETLKSTQRYVVESTYVVSASELAFFGLDSEQYLLLSTCFPFQSIEPSEQRYVVVLVAQS